MSAVHFGLSPSDFWRMHPQELWWYFEAKMPPRSKDTDWAELYEMLD